MSASIAVAPPHDLADEAFIGQILDVYRSAFAAPPWNESDDEVHAFRARLLDDAGRPGFRLVVALADGAVVGFSTSWSTPDPFPTGRSYTKVMTALGPDLVARRLVGTRVIDELAVHADRQGQGIARRLLDVVVDGGEMRAWLLTAPIAVGAVAFYRRIGWDELTAPDAAVHVFATPSQP